MQANPPVAVCVVGPQQRMTLLRRQAKDPGIIVKLAERVGAHRVSHFLNRDTFFASQLFQLLGCQPGFSCHAPFIILKFFDENWVRRIFGKRERRGAIERIIELIRT